MPGQEARSAALFLRMLLATSSSEELDVEGFETDIISETTSSTTLNMKS